jgi:hypothetical protein
MKATRANLLGEFTGLLDGLIYYRYKPGGKIYVRKQFTFAKHPAHSDFRSVQKAIYALRPSPGYIQNLKDYLILYNRLKGNEHKQAQAWTNIYNKLMYALAKKFDGNQGGENPINVDLATLTREDIYTIDLPCISVKRAIDAGLLPSVNGYELLDQEM